GNGITVNFTTLKAFKYAHHHWKSFSELIFVTTAVSTDGQREYFEVTSPVWNKAALSVTYAATLLNASDCFGEFTVNWGTPGSPHSPPVNTNPGSHRNHHHSSAPVNSGFSTKTQSYMSTSTVRNSGKSTGTATNSYKSSTTSLHSSNSGHSTASTATQSYKSSTPGGNACSKPTSSVID